MVQVIINASDLGLVFSLYGPNSLWVESDPMFGPTDLHKSELTNFSRLLSTQTIFQVVSPDNS